MSSKSPLLAVLKGLPVSLVICTAILFFIFPSARAQSYLTQVGDTTFRTTMPVELGYFDASTGNLHIEIPLGTWPQRGSHSFTAALVYDSRIWYINNHAWTPSNIPNSWAGWRLVTSPALGGSTAYRTTTGQCQCPDPPCAGHEYYYVYSNFTWTDPYGTVHAFPINTAKDRWGCYGDQSSDSEYANDSTGYLMAVTNYTTISSITTPDGTIVYPGYKDTNGNYFSTDSSGNVIDTLGRKPVTTTTNCNGVSSEICFTVLNSQGTTSTYTVTTQNVTLSSAFGENGISEWSGADTVWKSITLPDNTSYQFTYDTGGSGTYGELTGITLPTGGTISYGYATYFDAFGNANRWLNTRTSAGNTWTYVMMKDTTCASGYSYCQHTYVAEPNYDSVEYYFDSNLGSNGSWLATKITYYGSRQYEYSTTTWTSTSNYVQQLSTTSEYPDAGSPYPTKAIQYTYVSSVLPLISQVSEWNYFPYGGQPSTPDRTTKISYYMGRPQSVTVTNGAGNQTVAQTNVTYDAYGSNGLTTITGVVQHDDTFGGSFTARGNPTSISQLVSGSTFLNISSMTYDTTGQVLSVTDSNNNTTVLSYADNFYTDNGSNPPATYTSSLTNAYLTKVTQPIIGSETFGYYFGTGKQASSVDQNGADAYEHFVDLLDRITSSYGPALAAGRPWVTYSYNSNETVTDIYTGIVGPSNGCSVCRHDQRQFDSLGRISSQVLVSDPDGSTSIDTTYDSHGRVASISNPHRSGSNPTDGAESYTYDGFDRGTAITDQDSVNSVHEYFGQDAGSQGGTNTQLCSSSTYGIGYQALWIDEKGNKREVWTDGWGRLIEVDEPDTSGNLTSNTCYVYDLNNNLTEVIHGNETRNYSHDALSRVTSVSTPESGTINFYYTTAQAGYCSGDPKEVCRKTDAKGVTATYTWDALNRITQKSYSDSTPTVSYLYDQGTKQKSYMTGMSDGSGSTTWTFDLAGNILGEQRTISSIQKTISYTYNLDSSIASITYPSGHTVSYTYTGAQRPSSVVDSGGGVNYVLPPTSGPNYAPIGSLASAIFGKTGSFGGITEALTYNNRLQWNTVQASSSNGTLLNWQYCYYPLQSGVCPSTPSGINNDTVGTIFNNVDNGRTQTFTYDYLNRVSTGQSQATSGADCWGQNFGYDTYGNLLSVGVTKCSGGMLNVSVNSNNQITNSGFAYDANGNMTSQSGQSYAFDAEGRLTSAGGVTYTYDGRDLRVEKSNGTLYWRTFGGDVLAESDLQGNITNEYIFFDQRRIARRDSSGNVYYYFADDLGSTRIVSDSQGNKCFDADYTPFGQEIDFGTGCGQNYRFTGYEDDSESGFDYAVSRHYSPALGRFVQGDRLAGDDDNPQSLDRYSYVLNDPTNLTDPLGVCSPGTHPATTDDIKKLLSAAQKYANRGITYDPRAPGIVESNGKVESIDCSNLVNRIEEDAGFVAPNHANIASGAFFSTGGSPTAPSGYQVDPNGPQVGDVIAFKRPGHVAIVTGVEGGKVTQFFGSQSSTGPALFPRQPSINALPSFLKKVPNPGPEAFFQICVPNKGNGHGGGGGSGHGYYISVGESCGESGCYIWGFQYNYY